MAFLIFLLMVGLLAVWIRLSARFDEFDHRLALLEAAPDLSPRLADLNTRIWRLEQTTAAPPATPVRTEPRTAALPPPPPVVVPVAEAPVYVEPERPRIVPPPVEPTHELTRELTPEPSLTSRISTFAAGQQWEALLGGNLLNKIGAVLLVIGISLALGYSYSRVTPAGRASMALAFSIALLGSGIWTERRPNYRVFARGLIGAGWAALYATSYAIYAIPASRIIDNPFLGSLGTVLVALGMIAHSLRYRNQALAGLAYFAAFAALAATPTGPFAVISLIPLAASLIFLAIRFEWHSMALFGLLATYGTCISRGSSNAPLASTQTLFLAYWVIFEALDLLRTKRGTLAGGVEWIFPLNTAGLLGLSYLAWSHHQPEWLWFASACAAALFLVDATARMLLRPPSSFEPEDDLFERFRYGCFEASLILSALLGGFAVVGRVPGTWISGSLAIEAEILYLAGVRFRSKFLRILGAVGFVCSAVWIAITDFPETQIPVLQRYVWSWTPTLLFHAILFSINRAIRFGSACWSGFASALVGLVLLAETPHPYVGLAWIAFGVVLFEFGVFARLRDFRFEAYVFLAAGSMASLLAGVAGREEPALCLAVSLGVIYLLALQADRWHPANLAGQESRDAATGAGAFCVALAGVLLWRVVPLEYIALAWFGLALLTFELGSLRLPSALRVYLGPLAGLAVLATIATHADGFVKHPASPVWLTYFGGSFALWYGGARLRSLWAPLGGALIALGSLFPMAGIWLVVPDLAVAPSWALLATALLTVGIATGIDALCWTTLAVLASAFVGVFALDLQQPERILATAPVVAAFYYAWYRYPDREMARVLFWAAPIPAICVAAAQAGSANMAPAFMAIALVMQFAGMVWKFSDARLQARIVAALAFAVALYFDVVQVHVWPASLSIAALYGLYLFARKQAEDEKACLLFSTLGTLLLTALLYNEVSGSLLTVAWGFEGLALLGIGFALRERPMRLLGLVLFGTCILKLFLYDLRNLETIYRILSFIVLGLILIGVSWIYSHFRENLKELL